MSPRRSCSKNLAAAVRLILADVLGTKLIGLAMEVSAEMLNTVEVRANGCLGEVAAPQLLKHELA